MKSEAEKNWPVDFATLIGDMCSQSVCYKKEMKVEGMLAVTLDGDDVLIVKVNKHHVGKNDQFVIPKFTATSDASESMEPVLARLFKNIHPAHVSVSGLGSSKLVGELVITNSASSGMPQAKLILNEQQIPIGQKPSGGSERTSSPVHGSSAFGSLGTKKSLDSVIAKLHHQTSSGSTSSTDVATNQNQQPVVVASKAKNTVSAEVFETCSSENVICNKTNNVQQMDVDVTSSTEAATKSDGIPHLKKELINCSEKSSVTKQSEKPFVEKVVSSLSKSKTTEEQVAPPMKRQRVESMKYIQFKESLKMHRDFSKPKDNSSIKDNSNRKEKVSDGVKLESSNMELMVLDDSDSQGVNSPKLTIARSTPSRESLNTSSGSARSTPNRESTRIQSKTTLNSQATSVSSSGSNKKKISEKVGSTPVRTTAKVKRSHKGETPKLNSDDLDDSFQTQLRTRPKKGANEEQNASNKNASSVSNTRINQGKSKLTGIKSKDGLGNKDEPLKKSMRLSKKADAVAKAADQKISSRKVNKSKFKVVSSKASKRGITQAQAKKIVKNIRSRQQQKAKGADQSMEGDRLKRTKRMCLKCVACLKTEDCGTCQYCLKLHRFHTTHHFQEEELDKPKYGGQNTLRQKCVTKQCKIYGLHKT